MKDIAVLGSEVSDASSFNLAEMLGADLHFPFQTKQTDFRGYRHVFKYGFSPKIKANNVFNRHSSTLIAINKIKSLSLFEEEPFGIPITTDKKVAISWIEQGYHLVARAKAESYNGEGLAYCYTRDDVNTIPAKFWTIFMEHTNEIRVNCWRGKVVSIYDKQTKEDLWSFKLWVGQENHPQLVDLAQKVWKKAKIDWCGLDVLRGSKGELYLLEINSAPILYPYTLKKLVNILKEEIKK